MHEETYEQTGNCEDHPLLNSREGCPSNKAGGGKDIRSGRAPAPRQEGLRRKSDYRSEDHGGSVVGPAPQLPQ